MNKHYFHQVITVVTDIPPKRKQNLIFELIKRLTVTHFPPDVIRCLEERGMVVTMTPIAGEKLLDQPLKCHKCVYSPQNMPKLKQHLYKHINN